MSADYNEFLKFLRLFGEYLNRGYSFEYAFLQAIRRFKFCKYSNEFISALNYGIPLKIIIEKLLKRESDQRIKSFFKVFLIGKELNTKLLGNNITKILPILLEKRAFEHERAEVLRTLNYKASMFLPIISFVVGILSSLLPLLLVIREGVITTEEFQYYSNILQFISSDIYYVFFIICMYILYIALRVKSVFSKGRIRILFSIITMLAYIVGLAIGIRILQIV